MKEILIGAQKKCEDTVTVQQLAINVGSGDVSVYATPMMIALIEKTASQLLSEYLDEGETSVGTRMQVSHLAATPEAMQVYATAKILQCDGRKITFGVEAYDECGLIGEGTHERFVVYREKFNEKARNKLKKAD